MTGSQKSQSFEIRPFLPADQSNARALILTGLGEHFGEIDYSMNPDLDDIQTHYVVPGGHFLVVDRDGHLVGTGALIFESPGVGRLVRMSVDRQQRGQGIGRALVEQLLAEARRRGYRQVVCETNHDWEDAIALYRRCGFRELGVWDGDRHFAIELDPVATELAQPTG